MPYSDQETLLMLDRLTVPGHPLARPLPEPFTMGAGTCFTSRVQLRFWQHLWRLSEPARLVKRIRKGLQARRQVAPKSGGEGCL